MPGGLPSKQAKHNAKKREAMKEKGMSRFEAWIYPADKERIQRYIERLNKQREKIND